MMRFGDRSLRPSVGKSAWIVGHNIDGSQRHSRMKSFKNGNLLSPAVWIIRSMKKTASPAVGERNVYELCEIRSYAARSRPSPSFDSFRALAAPLRRDSHHYTGNDNYFLWRRNIWDHICDCSLMHP